MITYQIETIWIGDRSNYNRKFADFMVLRVLGFCIYKKQINNWRG